MKVEITFVDTHTELTRDSNGYRFTFKYADDSHEEPLPLNECESMCGHGAAHFSSDFFSMEGILENCFPRYTKIQTYRYNSGTYPMPFNGKTGKVFKEDTDLYHVKCRTLVTTCAVIAEAVCEISTVCSDAYEHLKKYAKKFESENENFQISFVEKETR